MSSDARVQCFQGRRQTADGEEQRRKMSMVINIYIITECG